MVISALIGGNPLSAAEAPAALKVGMLADSASFDDQGFNQVCKQGLERAERKLKVAAVYRTSAGRKDYEKNLNALILEGCRLIIGVGLLMHAEMGVVARKNPDVKFALIDSAFYPPQPNALGIQFNVNEAAFPAGFLAAAWADLKDPQDPQVGYVGGMKIDSVDQFVYPYQAGVAYYNQKYAKKVKVAGAYANSFNDRATGQALAEKLIDRGVEVVFGLGGETGAGALAAAKKQGRWGIGVDVDQYNTLPDVKDMLLTSVLKKMDNAVFALVQSVLANQFDGGGTAEGTLAKGLVGLAPFHDFDQQIPAAIKKNLDEIQQKISAHRLATGWPPSLVIPW